MGEAPRALAIAGVMSNALDLARDAAAELGEIALWGEWIPFDHTDYYEGEHGPNLQRAFCVYEQLTSTEALADLKHRARDVEARYAVDGKRRVNLDTGTLDGTRLVLASFKPGPYKLYLGREVWADFQLFYVKGRWEVLPWTFPDITDHTGLFEAARELLRSRGMDTAVEGT